MTKPVWNHRELIGYARTEKHVVTLVKKLHQSIPVGWKVTVRSRNTDIIDLPPGWVYSIHP